MDYNFVEFAKNINAYAVIDALILVAVLVTMICFFVYKRNVKILILLLMGGILEILVQVLADFYADLHIL